MQLIKNATVEKLRGGYYTPPEIAKFILKWGINGSTDSDLLEPSCGDGVFLEQLKENKFKFNSITAIELDEEEALKAERIKLTNKTIINTDFHTYCNETFQRFDLIVGNPPYIRYQYFNKEQQVEAEKVFKRANLTYSKLTNAWVSFIVGASLLLKDNGKIGFVLPAELLQVSYAKQLREFISHFYNKINIISFKTLVFPEIQQEVVLLLCEKNNSKTHLIEHLELENAEALSSLDVSKLKSPRKKIDFKSNKWTFYFLDQREIDFLENVQRQWDFPTIGDYADIEIGITTGANDFFTVPFSTVKEYNLQRFARPMVGRSVQVSSLRFTEKDWEQNITNNAKAYFLVFPTLKELQHHKGALQYLAAGEEKGINKGYKCGIRDEWHVVPSIWIPDALFIRRNNLYPKLITNEAKAYTTDTMHRVSLKKGTNLNALCASYHNSLSFAFAEICGRSYGGGVLELMPSEVEEILIPYKKEHSGLLADIDKKMRSGLSIEKILQFTNEALLIRGYGFSKTDVSLAHTIWQKLSQRRLKRAKS